MIRVLFVSVAFSVILYTIFAFVNWDIMWAAHVGLIARCFFVLLCIGFFFIYHQEFILSVKQIITKNRKVI